MLALVTTSLWNSRHGRLTRLLSTALFAFILLLAAPANADYSASWQSVATSNTPPWRVWTAMTWASGTNRIVLWGGWGETFVNDMHAFDPVALDWQTIQPHTVCPGNSGFDTPNGSDENGVVYDPINDMLWILNGGSGYRCVAPRTAGAGTTTNTIVDPTLTANTVDFYKDFYVSDLTNYALVTAYNPATRALTLSNPLALGPGLSYKLFADAGGGTWSYSFATDQYSKLEARHWGYTGPLPTGQRLSSGFASNGSTYAILFGGPAYNYTYWAYDNSTWKLDFASKSYSRMLQMSSSGPAARAQIENQFVYDSLHDRFVLFGGRCRDQYRCGFVDNRLNDTWVYDPQANSWTEIHPAVSPPPRDQGQMYFDTARGVVVLYGGENVNGVLSDLWVFDLGAQTWTQVTTTGTPFPLYIAAVAYAPTTGCGYLVQGNTSGAVPSNAIYEICLTGSNGNVPPVANIAVSPSSGSVGTVFHLDGGASADSDGRIVSYAWNLGDGTSATGASVNKSYATAGNYTVTLTVTDNLGATGSTTTTVTVTPANIPPTVSLTSPATGATFAPPATVSLAATAADSDGTVSRVDFYRGATLIGSDTSAPYIWSDTGLAAGTYSYTAVAYDNAGASTISAATTITVTSVGATSVNVAAAANGGVATASSSYNTGHDPSGAINGDRKGLNWGAGGGWNDSTPNSFPDWLQVTFSATQSIGEIDIFSVQDSYQTPLEPTSSMTFTKYGITSFQVQYWNGAAWTDVPGGNVTGNNLVWRKFTFTPVTTDRVRVLVNGAVDPWSRITEIEAWTAAGTTNLPPAVSLTSPATGATFAPPATVSLAATAADSDGTVSRVDFYRGATLIGSDTSAPYIWSDTGLAAGTYSYTAVAYDNAGASTISAATTITVTSVGATSVNVAAAANGGVATASSSYNTGHDPSGAINGDRKGLNWGAGGGWNDSTPNSFPDWLQVTFSATQSIGEIDIFSVQDSYQTPLEPTSSMTFTKYGITSFQVQYWNGAAWTDVPGGNVTGNNLVWRKFTFTPVTTDRVRVLVNGAVDPWSRITEIEAWTAAGTTNLPPAVSLTSPATGATFAPPATVSLAATAADSDGTVSRVDFYRGATLIGSDTSAPYIWSDTGLAAGTYSYTAVAYDNAGASTISAATTITVTSVGATSVNVAAAANGGVATASSSYNTGHDPSGAINGDRKGLNWGAGGGWNDSTPNSFPDWLQVTFSATQSIGEIDIFSVQDSYQTPLEPTSSMTFTKYGITSFQVQYWNGAAWTDVPGGNVTGNNLVWRKFTFTPVTTDRVRVLVNGAVDPWSRITEIEAWTAAGTTNLPPAVSLTSPATGATFAPPATVSLAATAADSDGTVSRVDFYRGATLIGSDTSAPYIWSDTGLAAGTYSYTAVAYDNAGASTISAATTITVTSVGATSVNVAAAANGGVATASSSYNTGHDPSGAINGDRKGLNWGAGGGWNDSTPNSFPDWLQVTFSATQSIGEIDIFSVQDSYQTPLEPTSSMTFTKYGITSFQVQYWNGAAWTDVPGGNVTGNNLVWRKFTFTPVTTDRVRVLVNGAVDPWSRITEIEAWTL